MAARKKKRMVVLIACEESQVVCKAFRALGHEAYSCDLKPCSGGHPEWHKQYDCRIVIQERFWDLIIFHPDCTAMAVSGNRWYGAGTIGFPKRLSAVNWTIDTWKLIKSHAHSACLENPVSVIFQHLGGKKTQYIQPWMFGHGETKKTGLKLHNLPELNPTKIVEGREQLIWKMPPSANRKELRSKTYSGIASAFAKQWGTPVLGESIPAQNIAEVCHTAPNSHCMQAVQESMQL